MGPPRNMYCFKKSGVGRSCLQSLVVVFELKDLLVDSCFCFIIVWNVCFYVFLRRPFQEQCRYHDDAPLSLIMIRWLLWRTVPSSSGMVNHMGQWVMGRTGAAESAVHCCQNHAKNVYPQQIKNMTRCGEVVILANDSYTGYVLGDSIITFYLLNAFLNIDTCSTSKVKSLRLRSCLIQQIIKRG